MNNNVPIKTGLLLSDSKENTYRVISIFNDAVTMIQVTENNKIIKKRLAISTLPLPELRSFITKQQYYVVDEKPIDFSMNDLTEHEKETFIRYRDFVTAIVREYSPSYMRLLGKESKPSVDRLIEQVGLSREGARIVLVRYLQSGFKEAALMPN